MQCSECSIELDDALILVCDHNLCLQCAAKKSAGNGIIRCTRCASSTNLEPSSAHQLREMFPQYTAQPPSFTPPSRPISFMSRPPLSHTPGQVASPTLSSRSVSAPLPPPVALMMPMPMSMPMQMQAPRPYPQHQPQGSSLCGQCEASQADLRCLQCEELLCFDCSEGLHRKGKMATHQTVPVHVTSTSQSPAPMNLPVANSPMSRSSLGDRSLITMRSVSCAAHPDEVVQYFCLQCETRPMCSECVFRSGEHTNHLQDVVLIKKAFPKVRLRINELVVEFEKSIKEIKINEINLSENKKSMDTINASCKGQVSKLFSELRESLRVREQELIRQIESVVEKETKQVESEIAKNATKRAKIESVSRVLNSVRDAQSTDSAVFEREIDVLEAFSDLKSTVSESRAEALKTDLNLVQLFIPTDQVASMATQVEHIKNLISDLPGITPNRNAPIGTPGASSSAVSSREGSVSGRRRRGSSSKASLAPPVATSSDRLLMSAIEDAMKSS